MISINSQLAAAKANQILGFYDTIPAMDQKAFTAGFVEMLSIYPPAVLERAASPSRGLAAYVSYPNLAKFKELLDEWHAEHIEDLRRRGELRQQRTGSLRLCPPPDSRRVHVPGELANVHVPAGHVRYASLVEWVKTAELRLWKFSKSSDGRDGIWIPLNVWQEGRPAAKSAAPVASAARKVMNEIDEARAWGSAGEAAE